MKKSSLLLVICIGVCLALRAQTAEEMATSNYVPATRTIETNAKKGANYYILDGVRYTELEGQVVWVGETAVMNSSDGSFQVWFRKVPTKPIKYTIKSYSDYTASTEEKIISVALISDAKDNTFWATNSNSGSVKVKFSGDKIIISVKNVKLCVVGDEKVCTTITGQITLGKE